MDKRRWMLAGMWVAAILAIGAIYVTLEPPAEDAPTLDLEAAPLYEAERDRAPAASRLDLPVGDDEGSPSVYRGGRRHTGRSPYRGPASAERVWRYEAGGRITAQAVVAPDGTIYVGDHARHLHALRPNGERLWVAHTFGPVWSAAAVIGDTVYVGSDADAFFALSRDDGRARFRIHADGDADGSISVAPDGTLRFTAGRDLYALRPDGELLWRFRTRGGFLLSTPAIDEDGTAYVGSLDDHLYAVASDGRMRWSYRTGGDISSSPVIGDDGTIYVGSDDRHVHAVTRDGERRWATDLDGYVRAPVALGRDGSVIAAVYGPQPRVVSLDAADGSVRWYFPVGIDQPAETGIASGPLVDAGGNVYFGAPDDFVYSLTPQGRLRWIHRTGGDVDAAPILTPEGVLLVGCDDGFLYAIADERRAPDAGARGAPDGGASGEAGAGARGGR